jgi:uncharacterized phage-like protein YoqJ
MITIAFTGHRPDKLDGYEWNTLFKGYLKIIISNTVVHEILNKHRGEDVRFIFGGALGIDQMAFDVMYKLQSLRIGDLTPKWTYEIAIPCLHQPNAWSAVDRKRYDSQLRLANVLTYVDTLDEYKIFGVPENVYYEEKLQERNKYMVDQCDYLVAVWDGSKGGTANCVRYAKKHNKEIIRINSKKYLTEFMK